MPVLQQSFPPPNNPRRDRPRSIPLPTKLHRPPITKWLIIMQIAPYHQTMRIHLDDANTNNGPLSVIPGSHRQGILSAKTIQIIKKTQVNCLVNSGGVVVMKPLLVHISISVEPNILVSQKPGFFKKPGFLSGISETGFLERSFPIPSIL